MMRLVLFDIDGTLILTGGAGMRAFFRAFKQVFDLAVSREVIRPDGKTDPLIAKEILRHFGLETRWNTQSRDALFAAYLDYLDDEMSRAREDKAIRILPGVKELLDYLKPRRDYALGLVTGNLEGGARIKLEKAGLESYFSFGGYGSDSEDRTALIRKAIERGTELAAPVPMDAAYVIGDTPLDIIHGHAAGASVIAVASARYSLKDLQQHYPDFLVASLSPVEPILSYMGTTLQV
jgi:phosphoglycolate phosphatase-like HAD superfamily hydrolase